HLVVDADRDEVRVDVPQLTNTRAQDRELLDGETGYVQSRVESMHDQVREGLTSPLVDGEPLVKLWAERALDEATTFHPEWTPPSIVDTHATVWYAPALVLRRRERASLIAYYDGML